MAIKLPVDFEEKVKGAPPIDGRGYPYQLSAKDLMKNFKALADQIPDGLTENDTLRWNGKKWVLLTAPSVTGTFVLGSIDGVMQWLATEECS